MMHERLSFKVLSFRFSRGDYQVSVFCLAANPALNPFWRRRPFPWSLCATRMDSLPVVPLWMHDAILPPCYPPSNFRRPSTSYRGNGQEADS